MELSGLPFGTEAALLTSSASEAEIEEAWALFDIMSYMCGLLHGIDGAVSHELETINYGWTGGPADEPPTEIDEQLRHVRSFLGRRGYEEVRVDVLRSDVERSGFRQRVPEGHPPRWQVTIKFTRGEAGSTIAAS